MLFTIVGFGAAAIAAEEPSYKIVSTDGDFEIRAYAPYCVVETFVAGTDFNDASNAGFKKLFKYISGDNRSRKDIPMTAPVTSAKSEKIEMTAPVTSSPSGDGYIIGFVMPEGFTLETTPLPLDSTLRIREVPARTVAVIRFSGRWTSSSMDEHEALLLKWITSKNHLPIGQSVVARYDPPIMPWFLRRNEIQIEIAP